MIYRPNLYALGALFLVLLLTALGFLPGTFLLPAFIGLIAYVAFIPGVAALQFLFMSLPFYFAVPVTASYIDLQSWRLLIIEIVLIAVFRLGVKVKEVVKINAVDIGLAVFVLVSLISSASAGNVASGVRFSIWLVNLYLFFIAFRLIVTSKDNLKAVLKGLGIGVAIMAVAGVGQLIFFWFTKPLYFWQYWANSVIPVLYSRELSAVVAYSNSWFSYAEDMISSLRVFSLMPGSHYLAVFLILSLPALLLLKQKKYTHKPWFWTALIVLTMVLVVLTGVRGIWLTIVIPALTLALGLLFRFFNFKIFGRLAWPLAVLLLILLIFPFVQNRAQSTFDPNETSNNVRLEIWQESVKEFKHKPVLGQGTGNYASIFDSNDYDRIFGEAGITPVPPGQMSAHNLYLHILVENGIFGLFALVFLLGSSLYFIWRKMKTSGVKFAASAVAMVLIWIYAYNMFDVVFLYNDKIQIIFWSVLGLINAIKPEEE